MNQARPTRNAPPFAQPDWRMRPVLALVAAAALSGCAGDAPVVMNRSAEAAAADAAARQRLLLGGDASTATAGLWPGPGYTPYPYPLVDPHRAMPEPTVAVAAAAAPAATTALPERAPVRAARPAAWPELAAGDRAQAGPVRHEAWAMAADGPMTTLTADLAPRLSTGALAPALAADFHRGPARPDRGGPLAVQVPARRVALQQPATPAQTPTVLPTMVSAQG